MITRTSKKGGLLITVQQEAINHILQMVSKIQSSLKAVQFRGNTVQKKGKSKFAKIYLFLALNYRGFFGLYLLICVLLLLLLLLLLLDLHSLMFCW